MIYQIHNALIGYPGYLLLDHINFEVKNNEKIAIVGRNGCGKTTLLKVIAGKLLTDNLDSDEEFYIQMDGKPVIGYQEQISFENEDITVREELSKVYDEIQHLKEKMDELTKQMESESTDSMLKEYARLSERFEFLGGYTYQAEMVQIFTKFGFTSEELDRPIAAFSGGQKTKIAFVKLLLSKPDIMLLDEPTNHLDLPTIEWLEGYLKNYKRTVIIVSHDRMFLDRVTSVTYEIEHKRMIRYQGNYTEFLRQKQVNFEKQCKDYEAQQKEIARLTEFIEKWKNTPTKVAMTRSKKMQIEHMVKVEKPMNFDRKPIHAQLVPKRKSQREVVKVKNLGIGYDSVLSTVDFCLERGKKMAVIGENGKGKSTLLKTIVGQIPQLSGESEFGRDVDWIYFDQELLNLNPEKTVIDEFWDEYPALKQTEVRTILGNFLFTGDDVFMKVSQLSGGERVRLSLAKLLKRQANLLILDEPTNHLDIIGKEALERMLIQYEGTILFVSHDRYFIKAIADTLLIFEHDQVNLYPYTYDRYLELKQEGKLRTVHEQLPGNMSELQSGEDESDSLSFGMGENKRKPDPLKEQQKLKQKMEKLEQKIAEQEQKVNYWKLKYTEPEIAADYAKLGEINAHIEEEEAALDLLLMDWAGHASRKEEIDA